MVTATMPTKERPKLQLTHKDTLKTLQGCTESGSEMTCKFKLGYYDNYESLGMSEPWQRALGWVSGGSLNGIRSVQMDWL